MDVEGRRVLLTGASRAIGPVLAAAFAAAAFRSDLVARSGEIPQQLVGALLTGEPLTVTR